MCIRDRTDRRKHTEVFNWRGGYMNKNTAGKKTSILKKNENMTILFIFLGFLAAITILQLCMNAARGAVGFPN